MPRDGTDPAPPAHARAGSPDDLAALGHAMPDDDGEDLVGATLEGRYRIESVIGRGGMGLVYRASQLGLRRQVALKILYPALAASPDVRSRFEREAYAVGRVDHPNCIRTYDRGTLPGGALYLAMELLEGQSLADVLERDRQLAPARALHILAHMLRGLGAIHRAGLIHRDIKPENIFLVPDQDDLEVVKIIDFGIAKPMKGEIDDGVRLTQAGMAFGTPIYMAPEQALGAAMDGRADLYAAAVVAYEMLTGKPPFYSDDKLEVMSMHTARPVPAMRTAIGKHGTPVPASVERLIARGLTKRPAERYADADEFLAAVDAVLATSDGGSTDVLFVRPTTGSQPLVALDDRIAEHDGDAAGDALDSAGDTADRLAGIGAAIDDVLAAASASTPATRTGAAPRPPAPHDRTIRTAPPPAHDDTIFSPPPTRPTAAHDETIASAAPPPPPRPGGVGLGLPYTGPGGEPIFGLTPAQRLATIPPAPRRSRVRLYAAIAGLAVAAGAAVALLTTRHGGDDRAPGVREATEALERGDVNAAIAALQRAPDQLATDPAAQRLLGHAQAARSRHADALAAYARALTLDPSLEADAELRADLRTMAANKDPAVVAGAFDLWLGHTRDPAAKRAIANAAAADDPARRHAVVDVIARYHADDAIDWVAAYALDLQQLPTCEERRGAVVKLRALGDPRAVPALELASVRQGATGTRNRRVNACLLDAATEAIGYLDGLRAPAPPK